MKRVIMVLLVSVMLLGTAAVNCQAEPAQFWVESLVDGEIDINGGPEADFSMTYLGMEYQWNRFKLGFEYGSGELEGLDVDLWEVKAGYRLIDKAGVDVDLYLSGLDMDGGIFEVEGVMAGVDLNWYLTKRSTITASAGYSLDAELNDLADLDVITYKLKYTWNVTSRVGLMAGYRGYVWDFDNGPEVDVDGFFAGISFRF